MRHVLTQSLFMKPKHKSFFSFALIIVLIFFIEGGLAVSAEEANLPNTVTLQLGSPYITINEVNIKEIVEGKQITPFLDGETTLVPIRSIVEGLGGYVYFDEQEQRITLELNENIVFLWLGRYDAYHNGNRKTLAVMPKVIDGYTMVPVRFVAESLNCDVQWIEASKTIKITANLISKNPEEVRIRIDGNYLNCAATIENGIALAPYTEIAEALGASIDWNFETKELIIKRFDKIIHMQIGSKKAIVNGTEIQLEAAPILLMEYYNDDFWRDYSILVPVEFIAEELGNLTGWGKVSYGNSKTSYNCIFIVDSIRKINYSFDQKLWAIAPSININTYNGGYYDIIGGFGRSLQYARLYKRHLSNGWGIEGRDDYINAVESLALGQDTIPYAYLSASLGDKDIAAMKNSIADPHSRELFNIHFYEKYKDTLMDKGLIAWDYARIVQISGWAYVAGYVSLEEAYDISMEASKALQKVYSSWEEFAEHYMIGYEFWSGTFREDNTTLAYKRHVLNQEILNDPDSPWSKLPWDLDLNTTDF